MAARTTAAVEMTLENMVSIFYLKLTWDECRGSRKGDVILKRYRETTVQTKR